MALSLGYYQDNPHGLSSGLSQARCVLLAPAYPQVVRRPDMKMGRGDRGNSGGRRRRSRSRVSGIRPVELGIGYISSAGLCTQARTLMRQLIKFYTTHVANVLPARLRDGGVIAAPSIGGLIRVALLAVPRCSSRLPMTKNKNVNARNSTMPKPYASRGSNVTKGGGLSKGSTAFIEKMMGKEVRRKKKKEQKKTENDIVKRLAKNGLIDKDKASCIIKKKLPKNKKKKKKGSSLSSSSDSSWVSSSSSDSSSDSESSSSDDKKTKSNLKKKKTNSSSDDKPSTTAKRKSRKQRKAQKLTE